MSTRIGRRYIASLRRGGTLNDGSQYILNDKSEGSGILAIRRRRGVRLLVSSILCVFYSVSPLKERNTTERQPYVDDQTTSTETVAQDVTTAGTVHVCTKDGPTLTGAAKISINMLQFALTTYVRKSVRATARLESVLAFVEHQEKLQRPCQTTMQAKTSQLTGWALQSKHRSR